MKPLTYSKVDLSLQYAFALVNIGLTLAGFMVNHKYFAILLTLQLFINVYHFVTNQIHIQAKHRSVGFTRHRLFYRNLTLIYVPAAILITVLLIGLEVDDIAFPLLPIIWLIIPQCVLYAYIYLCKKELDFIERNEFHILK